MAFRQHHRPQPSRQLSFPIPQEQPTEVGATSSPQRKRPLEDSEEWILFSPTAAQSDTHTRTTSTERTPRTAGLSRLSDFGSLDTHARSDQNDDDITCQGTEIEDETELDSLDDGLHAFHEPSEYAAPASRLQQSGDTVLPTHDGLGTFQANSTAIQEQLWHFERPSPRRRAQRRRSSVQRRLDALEEVDDVDHDTERRQRIEKWRLEQSRALLEEIEKETRRRRRMSMVSAARSRTDSEAQDEPSTASTRMATSVGQTPVEDDTENLSFWQRLTRRVIRDLMGIDENVLSVIFGEELPAEVTARTQPVPDIQKATNDIPAELDISQFPGDPWEHRLLERIARELGILVHQISEHPGAFSTYLRTQDIPEYAGLSLSTNQPKLDATEPSPVSTAHASSSSPVAAVFAPTMLDHRRSASYSEASLWGIEEEEESDPLDAFRRQAAPAAPQAEDLARDQEYWERELDVKMVFNFLIKRFSNRHGTSSPSASRRNSNAPLSQPTAGTDILSARRAAIIRQHHPLVNRNADRNASSSTATQTNNRKRDLTHRHHNHHFTYQPSLRNQVLRSSSSCASQSTKKSKRSTGSSRNYWDLGGSVGSGSVLAGEV